jgi:hypothetical protein
MYRLISKLCYKLPLTIFLLKVLQKHLGYTIDSLSKVCFKEAHDYFKKELFKDEKTIAELVRASGGVPRDFLRIFIKPFEPPEMKLVWADRLVFHIGYQV